MLLKGAKIACRVYKAKKATKFLAYIGQKSKYINKTRGKSVNNRGTDVGVLHFIRNLRKNGRSFERKGSIFRLTKNGAAYTVRAKAKNWNGWTAEYFPKGHKGAAPLKIRLGDKE